MCKIKPHYCKLYYKYAVNDNAQFHRKKKELKQSTNIIYILNTYIYIYIYIYIYKYIFIYLYIYINFSINEGGTVTLTAYNT